MEMPKAKAKKERVLKGRFGVSKIWKLKSHNTIFTGSSVPCEIVSGATRKSKPLQFLRIKNEKENDKNLKGKKN